MSSRVVLRLIVLLLFVLTTIDSWIFVLQSLCYDSDDERSGQLPGRTDDADDEDPVVSALRDVMTSSYDDTFDCRKLFARGTRAHAFTMSADFRKNVGEFLMAVNSSLAGLGPEKLEGNSFQEETQYRLLHYLTSKLDFVQTVCETGFNAGHSSFNFLTARHDVTVHSFDLGRHRYVDAMAEYLQRRFPGRLNVVIGDSTETVPRYFRHPAVNSSRPGRRPLSCDLALVDGGHGFDVALSDIRNLARVASPRNNILIVDDVNTRRVRSAWQVALRSDDIQQLFTCRSGSRGRAFAVGVVGQVRKYSNNIFRRKSRSTKYWTGLYCSLYVCLSVVVLTAVVLMVLYT